MLCNFKSFTFQQFTFSLVDEHGLSVQWNSIRNKMEVNTSPCYSRGEP